MYIQIIQTRAVLVKLQVVVEKLQFSLFNKLLFHLPVIRYPTRIKFEYCLF